MKPTRALDIKEFSTDPKFGIYSPTWIFNKSFIYSKRFEISCDQSMIPIPNNWTSKRLMLFLPPGNVKYW